MTTFQITAVRTERPPGYPHEHIAAVKLNGTSVISRATVVADLRSPYGDRYYTQANGVYARVIIASCPHCGFRDYITTEPDWTTANNLLSLPRF